MNTAILSCPEIVSVSYETNLALYINASWFIIINGFVYKTGSMYLYQFTDIVHGILKRNNAWYIYFRNFHGLGALQSKLHSKFETAWIMNNDYQT